MSPIVAATVLVHQNPFGLAHVLRCLAAQSRPPEVVIVVDNGSHRPVSTPDVLADGVTPVDLQLQTTNLGVGAGHNTGIRVALDTYHADLVWVLEHDTFPDQDCLEKLLDAATRQSGPTLFAACLTRNNYERRWATDGRGLPRTVGSPRPSTPTSATSDSFTLNGILVSRAIIDRVGWLREDFVVGHEDWDYSRRVKDAGIAIVTVSDAVAVHPNKGDGRFGNIASPLRYYYSHRNLLASRSLHGRDRVVAAVGGVGRSFAEFFRPSRGPRYAIARLHAVHDGLRGRLGRREPIGVTPRKRQR